MEDGGLLLLNDNNYPLSAVRNPDEPDDTEAITIWLDALLNSPPIGQMPGTGGPGLLVPFGLALHVAVP